MTFAAGTKVSVDKSRAELDKLLAKHGATQRGIMSDDVEGRASVVFVLAGHRYRMDIPLPLAKAFQKAPKWPYKPRPAADQRRLHDQACRERWRAVVLLTKAKLELVALGVSTVEREFLADLVLPNGERLHEAVARQLVAAASSNAPLTLPPP